MNLRYFLSLRDLSLACKSWLPVNRIAADLVLSVFQSNDTIVTVSLGGTLNKHQLTIDENGVRTLVCIWTCATQKKIRTNTIRACSVQNEKWVVVGGVTEQGRGHVEVWKDEP